MNFPSAAIALFFVCASFLLLFFLISFVSVKLPIWGSVFQTARGQHVRAGPPFHPTVCPSGWQWHKCLIVITASVRVCLSGGGEIHALGNVRRLAVTLTPTQTPITHTHTHMQAHMHQCRWLHTPTHNPQSQVTSRFTMRQSNRSCVCFFLLLADFVGEVSHTFIFSLCSWKAKEQPWH